MKVAVISDIHGNAYALEAVLRAAAKEQVTKLLVLGDLVGYYYHPDRVLDMLGEWDHELIRGNHEDLLLAMLDGTIEESELRRKYGSGHRMAKEKLTAQHIERMTNAKSSHTVTIDNVVFHMHHGSPRDAGEYLYPDTDENVLRACDDTAADFVLVGHSHYPFVYRNAHSMLINAGAVGQSRTVGGLANWALIHTTNKSVEMKATPYSTIELEKEIAATDPGNAYLSDILKRNRFE